jgi:DNA-binding Lrp family transcriptional regulator
MDEKDREILEELMANGKAKIRSISRKAGLPMSTVHHRIMRMEDDGIIRRFSAIPDYKKVGLPICAYIFINVDYSKIESQDAVARQIRLLPNVMDVSIVSGDIDIIARIRAKDVDDLSDSVVEKLRNIKGVSRTVTSVVMKEIDS